MRLLQTFVVIGMVLCALITRITRIHLPDNKALS